QENLHCANIKIGELISCRRMPCKAVKARSAAEDERAKVLGHMIGIMVWSAGLLPAQEMALRIFAETIYAIQVRAPFRSSLDRMFAHRFQRNPGGCIPYMMRFIDTS